MSLITAALDLSAASQLMVLGPLCVVSALLAGRCRPSLNLVFDLLSLALSFTMAGVMFHAIDSTQNGGPTGAVRFAYYLTAGPILLALWAADGLLHRLALSQQARHRQQDAGALPGPAAPPAPTLNDAPYPQLSRG
jgi:hypothetical protein